MPHAKEVAFELNAEDRKTFHPQMTQMGR